MGGGRLGRWRGMWSTVGGGACEIERESSSSIALVVVMLGERSASMPDDVEGPKGSKVEDEEEEVAEVAEDEVAAMTVVAKGAGGGLILRKEAGRVEAASEGGASIGTALPRLALPLEDEGAGKPCESPPKDVVFPLVLTTPNPVAAAAAVAIVDADDVVDDDDVPLMKAASERGLSGKSSKLAVSPPVTDAEEDEEGAGTSC